MIRVTLDPTGERRRGMVIGRVVRATINLIAGIAPIPINHPPRALHRLTRAGIDRRSRRKPPDIHPTDLTRPLMQTHRPVNSGIRAINHSMVGNISRLKPPDRYSKHGRRRNPGRTRRPNPVLVPVITRPETTIPAQRMESRRLDHRIPGPRRGGPARVRRARIRFTASQSPANADRDEQANVALMRRGTRPFLMTISV